MLSIAGYWLLVSAAAGAVAAGPSAVTTHATAPCVSCHVSAASMLDGAMTHRQSERAFARRAFGTDGDRFFDASCAGCHVSSCASCHGSSPHASGKPKDEACLACHRGYFVGWDYYGRAPREDHARYQRGSVAQGSPFLKMLPDLHRERGMACADCHGMSSSQSGSMSTKTCASCHQPSPEVPEHAIAAHLDKMECYACHSAWAPQEYGTFLVRPRDDASRDAFSPLPEWGPWRKSAYLKRQDAPPLGLDRRGKVAPIRPQFILFATDAARRWENRLLVAEWRAYFPHTVRRGTVTCSGCHDQPRRFLLEPDAERLYLLEKDGLALRSFWSREKQVVTNGAFLSPERYAAMNRKTPEYVKQHLRQWQNLLKRGVSPSAN